MSVSKARVSRPRVRSTSNKSGRSVNACSESTARLACNPLVASEGLGILDCSSIGNDLCLTALSSPCDPHPSNAATKTAKPRRGSVGVSMELRCIRLRLKIILGLGPLLSGVGMAAEVHPALWPEQPPALAADPALEARIEHYASDMTLEQKVGQLIQADIGSIKPDDLRHYPLGSILNGGSSSPGNNEFAPPSEWLALADRFYGASMDPSHGARPIPIHL